MAFFATLAVLAILVFVIPDDGSWNGELELLMLLATIVVCALYSFHEERRPRKRD